MALPILVTDNSGVNAVLRRVIGATATQLGDGTSLGASEATPSTSTSYFNRSMVARNRIFTLHNNNLYALDSPYDTVTAHTLVQALPSVGTGGAVTLTAGGQLGVYRVTVNQQAKLVALSFTNQARISFTRYDIATNTIEASDTVTGGFADPGIAPQVRPGVVFDNAIFFWGQNGGTRRIYRFDPSGSGSLTNVSGAIVFGDEPPCFWTWQGQLVGIVSNNTTLIQWLLFTGGVFVLVPPGFSLPASIDQQNRQAAFFTEGSNAYFIVYSDAGNAHYLVQVTGTPSAPVFTDISTTVLPASLASTPTAVANDEKLSIVQQQDTTTGAAPASLGNSQTFLYYAQGSQAADVVTRYLWQGPGSPMLDEGLQALNGNAAWPTWQGFGGMDQRGFTVGQKSLEILSMSGVSGAYRVTYVGFGGGTQNVALYRSTLQDTVVTANSIPLTKATIANASGPLTIISNEIQGVPFDGASRTFDWQFFTEGFAIGDQFVTDLRFA